MAARNARPHRPSNENIVSAAIARSAIFVYIADAYDGDAHRQATRRQRIPAPQTVVSAIPIYVIHAASRPPLLESAPRSIHAGFGIEPSVSGIHAAANAMFTQ